MVVATGLVGMAWGDTVTYDFVRLEDNSAVNTEAYYKLDVSSVVGDNQVDFTFRNLSDNPATGATIIGVYFDDGALLGIASVVGGPGVDFKQSGGSNLPGGNQLDPDFVTTADFYANKDGANANGVQPGERLTIRFNLQDTKGFEDVLAFLDKGLIPGYTAESLRVGIHVGSLPGPTGGTGESDSFINGGETGGGPTVPLPASVWAGMALLGGLGLMKLNARRRQLA